MQKVRYNLFKSFNGLSTLNFFKKFKFSNLFSFPHGTLLYWLLKFILDFEEGSPILKRYNTCIAIL